MMLAKWLEIKTEVAPSVLHGIAPRCAELGGILGSGNLTRAGLDPDFYLLIKAKWQGGGSCWEHPWLGHKL